VRIFNKNILQKPCKNSNCLNGFIVDEKKNIQQNAKGEDIRCECYWQEKYLNANIGYSYWPITIDNFDGHPTDLHEIKKYFKSFNEMFKFGQGMYIHGGNGTGKTTLAILLLKKGIERGHSCFFAPFADVVILNSRIVGGFIDKEAKEAIQYIQNVDFLVLDDIGKEFDSGKDYSRATLNSILRYRDMWLKPTIYTANTPIEDLRMHYGDSNYSIMEGRSIILNSEYDDDYRKIKKAKNRAEIATIYGTSSKKF
jgi:DNA replication protein DnaC